MCYQSSSKPPYQTLFYTGKLRFGLTSNILEKIINELIRLKDLPSSLRILFDTAYRRITSHRRLERVIIQHPHPPSIPIFEAWSSYIYKVGQVIANF